MLYKGRPGEMGFTLVELMIVIVILGIMLGVAIPNLLLIKDKAVWGTAKVNLDVVRTALTGYAADSTDGRFPEGSLDFGNFRATVPGASLPPTELEAKWQTGTFAYACSGNAFTISVKANNRYGDPLIATLSGIEPVEYPH